MPSPAPEPTPAEIAAEPASDEPDGTRIAGDGAANSTPDHFVERDGLTYAGHHLIVDLQGASRLDDERHIERTLRRAVVATGATLLHIHLHRFTVGGGISGVALLAESHISVHTWPERNYAALDIFMCGDATPDKALAILEHAFQPDRMQVSDLRRGLVE